MWKLARTASYVNSSKCNLMSRVIITRIRYDVDQQLRAEHAGYKSGRSTTERISVLRGIIGQVIQWNLGL
jgi:hypothetical protein